MTTDSRYVTCITDGIDTLHRRTCPLAVDSEAVDDATALALRLGGRIRLCPECNPSEEEPAA